MIVNRCLVARTPTQYEHFSKFVATNTMPPVVTFLKTEVRFQFLTRNLCPFQPLIDLLEPRATLLGIERGDQTGK